jgi:hypothetical protein
MHVFGGMGLISVFVSFALATSLAIEKFVFHVSLMADHGPLLIFSGFLLLAGLVLICQGLIGEMFLRKFHQQQHAQRESQALRIVTRYKRS